MEAARPIPHSRFGRVLRQPVIEAPVIGTHMRLAITKDVIVRCPKERRIHVAHQALADRIHAMHYMIPRDRLLLVELEVPDRGAYYGLEYSQYASLHKR